MKKVAQTVVGIGFAIGFFGLAAFLVLSLWDALTSLQPELAAGIASAGASIIAAAIVVVAGKLLEQRREIATSQRQKKVEIYDDFVNTWLERTLLAENLGRERMSDQELQEFFVNFTQEALLWSSGDVVRKWGRYRTQSLPASTDGISSMFEFEKVLAAIRKDVGLANKRLKQGDLLRLFINDVDDHLKRSNPPSLR